MTYLMDILPLAAGVLLAAAILLAEAGRIGQALGVALLALCLAWVPTAVRAWRMRRTNR